MDELLKEARWSDSFFNYVPAEQTYDQDEATFLTVAKEFLEVNPDCPYSAEWLVRDFFRRL